MRIMRRAIALTIGITVTVISLAVIGPPVAIGKENKQIGNPSIRSGRTLEGNVRTGAPGLSSKRRIHGSTNIQRHRAAGIFDDPFFFDVGAVRSHKRRAKR